MHQSVSVFASQAVCGSRKLTDAAVLRKRRHCRQLTLHATPPESYADSQAIEKWSDEDSRQMPPASHLLTQGTYVSAARKRLISSISRLGL